MQLLHTIFKFIPPPALEESLRNSTFRLALPGTLQDVRAWLIAVSADRQAVLAAGRITWMVIRGERLGSRPWTAGENEREPCRNIPGNFFQLFLEQLRKLSKKPVADIGYKSPATQHLQLSTEHCSASNADIFLQLPDEPQL